jgi:integrase
VTRTKAPRRSRGTVDRLPSGAYRVRVNAGTDPLTGRRHRLFEVVPPGPTAEAEAEKVRVRLLNQVDERRNPRTRATVNQLMDRYLDVLDIAETSREAYVSVIDNHIRPALGELPAARVDAEVLDSFYAQLRRCRARCDGRTRRIDHRMPGEHECNEKCRPHVCRPLAPASILKIHWTLSGAMARAVRWHWIAINPTELAQPPAPPRPRPAPPSAEEAARLLMEAWKDPAWATFLWVASTTGARRGELCALRRDHVDLDPEILTIEGSVFGTRARTKRKDTKTHQKRRIALDSTTVAILRDHLAEQAAVADRLGFEIASDAYLFSNDPDCSRPWLPGSVSQRYERLADRLGIQTSLHKLRHYNATELIAAGVDLRTVAGRLGHAGGGITTLRVYAAWVTEADKRAAGTVASQLPSRPERVGPVSPPPSGA